MKRKKNSGNKLMLKDYATLLAEVKERIRAAQYAVELREMLPSPEQIARLLEGME